MAVTIFNPICKLNAAPTEFIITIKIPPSTELIISFNTFFSGSINILPNISIAIIQDKKTIIVLMFSIAYPPSNTIIMLVFLLILLFYNYIAFVASIPICKLFIISTAIPFSLTCFIK